MAFGLELTNQFLSFLCFFLGGGGGEGFRRGVVIVKLWFPPLLPSPFWIAVILGTWFLQIRGGHYGLYLFNVHDTNKFGARFAVFFFAFENATYTSDCTISPVAKR